MNESSQLLFELWYQEPLAVLERIEDGSGATVAIATALFLYERYFSALKRANKLGSHSKNLTDQLAIDFSIDAKTAETFWEMSRNGLLHQGMFLQHGRGKKYPAYSMAPTYQSAIRMDSQILQINPWSFTHRVLDLWKGKIDLFDSNPSIPLAKRYRSEKHYFTDYPGHVEETFVECKE